MKITFLGTGTSVGVPMIGCHCKVCKSTDVRDRRLRTSALVEVGDKKILIDVGPDFRTQMLSCGAERIDAVLLTHHHYDHVGGMDDLRAVNHIMHQSLSIYANAETVSAISKSLYYVFEAKPYPGVARLDLHTVYPFQPFEVAGVSVLPLSVMHGRLPIAGYRIGRLAYITDASVVPPETIEALRGVEVLVVNALRFEPHPSHMSLAESLQIVESVAPREAYFIHMSHDIGLASETEKLLPNGCHLAYDGLCFEVAD